MLRITVCDDESFYIEEIKKLVIAVLTKIPVLFSITCFSSGEELFKDLQNGSAYDIALLDIHMNKMDGIDIAEKIRKYFQNDKTILIYISNYDIRAKEVLQFNTHRFLSKPIDYLLFEEALLSANILWEEQQPQNFCFKDTKSGHVGVPIKDILYMESARNHRVDVTTVEHVYTMYDVKLSDIHENLSSFNFILIHHSILVNFSHINVISYEEIKMSNGKILNISGPKRKQIRELFSEIRKRQEKNIWL
ncbi:LytR/AlgR family response regulator transcription factor [Lacrimispora brassicae]